MIHSPVKAEGHLVKETDDWLGKCGHTAGRFVKGMDFADRMKFSPSILEMALVGRIRSRVDRTRMGANPLPRPGRYRKGAIYADCAIVRVKRGREGRGPHLILGGSAKSREFSPGGK